MFCDKTEITVKAWKWWNGCTSARKEKHMPFWWPNWWDWWVWWDVIIRVNPHLNTLIDLHARKRFAAEEWEFWMWSDMHWKNWEALILKVPKWTIVKNLKSWEVFDLKESNAEVIIAKWGRGWYWNAHFTTSRRRFPDFAELWEPTYEIDLELELQLVADVWIIWLPSAWKSSLIANISNLKPKIADYHFTTLIPNIWVVKIFDNSLVFTDIPWLIEWASEWKWLWHEFLRHVSRNSILIHLIDWDSANVVEDFRIIQNELKKYSKELFWKKQFVAINKIDLFDEECVELLKEEFLSANSEIKELYFISAVSWKWTKKLLWDVYNFLEKEKKKEMKIEDVDWDLWERILYTPHLNIDTKAFTVEEIIDTEWLSEKDLELIWNSTFSREYDPALDKVDWKRAFRIEWIRIVQIAKMTNFYQKWWVDRLYDVLKKMKIHRKLEEIWTKHWDVLLFWDHDKALKFREEL